MYPAFDWSSCSGPSWISARVRSHYRTGLMGPFGSPVFARAGKTDPPSLSSSRRPRQVTGIDSGQQLRGLCSDLVVPPRLKVLAMSKNTPGDAGKLVGERDREHV